VRIGTQEGILVVFDQFPGKVGLGHDLAAHGFEFTDFMQCAAFG